MIISLTNHGFRLNGDQLYRVDYRDLLQEYLRNGAEVTPGQYAGQAQSDQ